MERDPDQGESHSDRGTFGPADATSASPTDARYCNSRARSISFENTFDQPPLRLQTHEAIAGDAIDHTFVVSGEFSNQTLIDVR